MSLTRTTCIYLRASYLGAICRFMLPDSFSTLSGLGGMESWAVSVYL